ncbi:MAG: NAD-binding protein, partial [Candidatus Nanohaloarchaea archaeon]
YLTALQLDQTSEFTLILTIQLFLAGAIGADVFHGIVLAAAATMVTSSYTSRHGDWIYDFLDAKGLIDPIGGIIDHEVDPAVEDHSIIAGFDVQGKQLAEFLEQEERRFVVIDNDPDRIIEARGEGYQYVFGDVMADTVWETAQVDDADLIISTIPFPSVSDRILSLEADADIILRSEEQAVAADLADECLYVINSDVLATQRIIGHIQNCLESDEYREQLREESMEELS